MRGINVEVSIRSSDRIECNREDFFSQTKKFTTIAQRRVFQQTAVKQTHKLMFAVGPEGYLEAYIQSSKWNKTLTQESFVHYFCIDISKLADALAVLCTNDGAGIPDDFELKE